MLAPPENPHDPGMALAAQRAELIAEAASELIKIPDGGEVRVGTASWTDPTMTAKGVFYPDDARTAEDRLKFYADLFPVVEVDATYYAIPRAETAELWVERTPDRFLFDVKAYALMTGQPSEVKRIPKPIREGLPKELADKLRIYGKDLPAELYDSVFEMFREAIKPLQRAGKLGTVFLQYPRWIFPSNEAREAILDARGRLGEMPVAVEFRNGAWFNERNAERTLRFLEDNDIPLVMVDEPQGLKSSVPPFTAVTSDRLAVVRFHGRRVETWEKKGIPVIERFRYLYDEDELADWVPQVRAAARKAAQTHVLMNNCFGNYGTTNAREFASLLRQASTG
ncbi:MAG: DUF72 domain-containing protein [Chloroflexi bacterium]|nr:MAG: DUF72 domain-containing protein [Chloroflexota bacterium]